jgi:hypothetical protein
LLLSKLQNLETKVLTTRLHQSCCLANQLELQMQLWMVRKQRILHWKTRLMMWPVSQRSLYTRDHVGRLNLLMALGIGTVTAMTWKESW